MRNWLQETFSADSTEEDVIQSRSLNITRIAGVVVPVVTAIGTAIANLADTEPWSQPEFQQRLFFALLAFVAAVTVADIFARAIASAAAHRATRPAASLFPVPLAVAKEVPKRADVAGRIVAFRTSNAEATSEEGEYLFVSDDGTIAEWVKAQDVHLP
jgi:F0F1-type ATP synthase assembly protein I